MGQALYRKYRSKSLKEIIGQEHITDTLAEAIKSGRISHAYLLTGPRGVGKTSIARILAYELNGIPYDNGKSHLDIIEIDAASNNGVEDIRDLREKVSVAPSSGKYKVYIIDEVHMLSKAAFNALLKTLEEPPAHVIFILATTEAHKLPETIISRTQRYIFRPIEPTKAVKHLKNIAKKEAINITDEALELVVEHGNGSLRDSTSLLDQLGANGSDINLETVQRVLGIAPVEAVKELLDCVRSGQPTAEIYERIAALIDQGYQPANIAKQLANSLRGSLLEGSEVLTNDIALLNTLLGVALSHDPEAALEVALIGYRAVSEAPTMPTSPVVESKKAAVATAPTPAISKPTAKPVVAETKPVPEPQVTAEVVVEPTKKKPKLNGGTLDADNWQQVLDVMKKQYNTLYGIVRMAQPDFATPGVLTLAFKFAFHQKRANEAKNRKIISDAVAEVTGSGIEIMCVQDSDAKAAQPTLASDTAVPTTKGDESQSALSAISNIFGGVEMVE